MEEVTCCNESSKTLKSMINYINRTNPKLSTMSKTKKVINIIRGDFNGRI